MGARQTVLSKEIVTETARSGMRILWTPREVRQTVREGSTLWDVNTYVAPVRLTPPIQIFSITSDSPTRTGTQEIFNPICPTGPQLISNAKKLKTPINVIFDENSGPRSSLSKLVGCKVTGDTRVDVKSPVVIIFGSNSVVTPNPNFVSFGSASVNSKDKLGSINVPTTTIRS